jgi:uncharacterized protein (UPF0212 family)
MSEVNNIPEETDAIRAAVRKIADLLAAEQLDAVVQACSETRLSVDEIRAVIHDYGRRLVPPPPEAYSELDVVKVAGAKCPTWSVRAPLYTAEEGMSDLTLEVTIAKCDASVQIELDDIHVL